MQLQPLVKTIDTTTPGTSLISLSVTQVAKFNLHLMNKIKIKIKQFNQNTHWFHRLMKFFISKLQTVERIYVMPVWTSLWPGSCRFVFYFKKEIKFNNIIVVLVSLKYLKNQENTDKTWNSLQCDSSEAQQFQGSKEFLSV